MNSMTREQLKEMPKGEFHLHLEGSLPYSFLRDTDPKRYAEVPVFWNRDYRFNSFPDFDRELLSMAGEWFNSIERYHTAAKAIFDDAREQGVKYLETSIASGCLEFGHLDLFEVCAAVKSTIPPGLEVKLFLGIHHSGYSKDYGPLIEEGLTCKNLDGFDLHGDETDPLGKWAAKLYKRARKAGKFTKCHGGEFMGPDFVNRAVNELGVDRIEHGVRSLEDPETVDMLIKKGITLDICPVSNIKLKVAPSYEEHPLRKLFDRGVKCTINRDDPLMFGSTLEEEYHIIQEKMNFTDAEVVKLVKYGFEAALVTDEKRTELYKDLDDFLIRNGLCGD